MNVGIAARCLERIAIALNRRSVFGQIQYTKSPEHLCQLNKLLQLVLVLKSSSEQIFFRKLSLGAPEHKIRSY